MTSFAEPNTLQARMYDRIGFPSHFFIALFGASGIIMSVVIKLLESYGSLVLKDIPKALAILHLDWNSTYHIFGINLGLTVVSLLVYLYYKIAYDDGMHDRITLYLALSTILTALAAYLAYFLYAPITWWMPVLNVVVSFSYTNVGDTDGPLNFFVEAARNFIHLQIVEGLKTMVGGIILVVALVYILGSLIGTVIMGATTFIMSIVVGIPTLLGWLQVTPVDEFFGFCLLVTLVFLSGLTLMFCGLAAMSIITLKDSVLSRFTLTMLFSVAVTAGAAYSLYYLHWWFGWIVPLLNGILIFVAIFLEVWFNKE
ncbi:MAG TPA: hypothetical protein VLI92_03005 [Candidatus Saccharimonadales bacterium]|nr:hypothetical protein [Candidatus Saccharimonadales bacterium]